jgi:hypothetical protein
MAKIEQFSRLINHRITTAGQGFTIPTSNDHTDETWLATDLYIGEIGVNVTDDKAFMRTNNGIIQLATGTSSGGTSSTSQVFVFNSPNIQIGSTYSADALIPRSGYYTDLGSTTLRWKDLYLGGSIGGQTTIDTNGGVYLKTSTNGILTSDGVASGNAPIEIHTNSSNANKDRPLFLNVRFGQTTGSTNYITGISGQTINFVNNSYVIGGAGTSISFDDGISYATHFGRGLGRGVYENDMHIVSGKGAVKGMADDGTGQYDKSEWITTQALLRTTDANMTDIVNIPWTATASGGNVIQVKAYLVGTIIDDASKIYSAEVMGCYSISASFSVYEIGTPISNVVSSWTGTQPDCEMFGDSNGFYIKVKGVGTETIQWLCSYSYHKLINIV